MSDRMQDPAGDLGALTWRPLSAAQRGLFFAHQLAPQNPCYTTAEVVEFDGPVDPGRLGAAVRAAYAEFEQLRAVYRLTDDGPRQAVTERYAELWTVEVADPAAAERWLRTDLAEPMDLATPPVRTALLRLPDGRCWWYHAAHHVVLDGYGAQQLLRRVAQLYTDLRPGPDAGPPGVPPAGVTGSAGATRTTPSLGDVLDAEPRDPDGEIAWRSRLARMSGTAALAGRVADPAPAAVKRVLELDDKQQRILADGAARLGVGWPDLLIAAVGGYLARMAGLPRVRIGLPLMNRSVPGVGALPSAHTVCTAMNVLPAVVPADGTVGDALAAVAAEQEALRAHPFTRQEELARELRRRDPGAQLFGAQVNLIPFDLELRLGAATGMVRNLVAGPVEDLTVAVRGTPGRRGRAVRLEIDANPRLYPVAEVELHLRRLAAWLDGYAGADRDTSVGRLPLLTDAERRLVTEGFNDTALTRPTRTLGQRFAAQAARTPDAPALVFAGRTRSYADLYAAAARIATGLRDRGIGPGRVVGVRLPRGFELYEAVHGIALAGAIYLPLDPDLPEARIEGMLEDAGAAFVIDDDTLAALAVHPSQDEGGDEGGSHAGVRAEAGSDQDGDQTAYLLFTSGSTGRPKGVLVGQAAIDNRLDWMQRQLPIGAGDRVLHKTPISFDVSVWELFWPLQVGACVVIAEPGAHRDPRAIAELIAEHEVSTLHFVPSMLRAFLADRVARARVADASVRHLITSGEALTPDLVAGGAEVFGVGITNLYGPTEAAIDVTCWECVPGEDQVPIGRPIQNTSCFVLDPDGQPVPIGVAGELWLGGVQLAEGYAGRPDLTAERFCSTRFGRLYRTGDLACWRPDGALRYLGRLDDQVKIRGQRVELGEIEAVFSAPAQTTGVAADAVGDRLVVWFVPAAGVSAAEAAAALRAHAADRL
ncbi:MAG: amino acid adenylation domain-containing protein, partial [Nocardioides sp.]|uniref:amino acid adenylation domain-containing protein n=1 Tax=Nocardioides sp. TaxID=35761 RepID=UPI0039E28F19